MNIRLTQEQTSRAEDYITAARAVGEDPRAVAKEMRARAFEIDYVLDGLHLRDK